MWIILNSAGLPAVTFTTMLNISVNSDGKISRYPVERGGTAAYNKSASPLDIRVTLGIAGGSSELSDAVDMLDALKKSFELVRLVTPECEYPDMSLESYSYARKREDGAGVIYFELHLVEIRHVAARYTNTITLLNAKNPESVTTIDNGKRLTSAFTGASWSL